MRLVKTVARELVDVFEDVLGLGLRHRARHRAVNEAAALLFHLRLDLLTHGAAQEIGAAKRIARQLLGNLHDLLLVDHHAEGLLQDAFEVRIQVVGLFLTVLTSDVARDLIHRTGAIECHQRDDVFEHVGLEAAQHVAHTRAFQLKHAGGGTTRHQVVGLTVVERQLQEIEFGALLLHQFDRALQNRQRLEAEEVEFHQTGRLDPLHIELGHRHIRTRIAVERHQLIEWTVADHNTGSMGRGVAVKPFELQRHIHQAANLGLVLAHLLQQRLAVDGVFKRHRIGRVVRHQFADAVDLAIGKSEYAADVAQDGAGLQLSEGDDLRHAVVAVFILDVANDLVATVLTEVDVEVRHGDAFGIQEPFEQQIEAQRIEIGDRQRPSCDAAGAGAAARPHWNALPLRPFDEVGHDQEVAGKTHLLDDVELIVETLAVGLRHVIARRLIHLRREDQRLQTKLQAFLRLKRDFLFLGTALRHREGRQDRLARTRHEGGTLGHQQRVVDRLRNIGEQRAHLVGGLEAMVRVKASPLRLGHDHALGDAEQRIMGLVHRGIGEEGLVGGDQRQPVLIGEIDERRLGARFSIDTQTGDFHEQAIVERLGKFEQRFLGVVVTAIEQRAADRAVGTCGQGDQSRRTLHHFGQRHRGRRAAFGGEMSLAHQPDQIGPTLVVLGQQDQLIGFGVDRLAAADVVAAFADNADLAADDRLHADRGHLVGEFESAEQIAGVGDRHRRHLVLDAKFGEVGNLDRPFKERIGGVNPEMNETRVSHGAGFHTPARLTRWTHEG